ncbi:SGNH hydrolase [Sphaerisporangium rufum]|uniref:SGNH hydrolase n=1 Tax=Sphaerisporangium rufum TaxID=1381558 RepID=A0A919V1L2_9ACTN|nr:SGNH hydrolase [Sphaerisporangium rufum]
MRGKVLAQVAELQVPAAIELKPDLVTFSAGANDLLRPGSDPDRLAKTFARAVRDLRASGAEVVLFTGVDPRDLPLMRQGRGRFAVFYLHVRSIADLYGCHLVDLWSMQSIRDWRAWSDDRLHMNAEGHRLVAAKVCRALGVPCDDDWRYDWPPRELVDRRVKLREDRLWLRRYLLPWIGRRLRGTSSGDLVDAKRPTLDPYPAPGPPPS